MRVRPRVLAVVPLLAAMVACVQASAEPTGPAQASRGIAAHGSAVRPTCDPDNGGLSLPDGFCALVVYDAKTAAGGPAKVRDIAVAPDGDVFVADQSPGGGVLALRDTNGDGKADETTRFGTSPGNGIYFRSPYLYFAPNDRVERYLMSPQSLTPVAGPQVIVSGLPATGNHVTKTIVVTKSGTLFVGVGSSTDSCQAMPGVPGSLGIDPCPDFPIRAGIWRYDANRPGQVHSGANRFATELRNVVAMALNPYDGAVYGVQQGRGSLNSNFPNLFTPQDDAALPAEEFFRFQEGGHYGWPYCYYDGRQQKKVLAPEYGGDGRTVGRCADAEDPLLAFPAHYAPNGLLFYSGDQFGEKYRGAAFIAFHGGTNNPEAYNVTAVPFTHGQPDEPEVFANGFIGEGAVKLPADADHRAMALAEGPDGSLYITDDAGGRIWRVLHVGGAAAPGAGSGNVPCSGAGGGAAGLVAAVNAANAGGGGSINLASGCTYALTSANNTLAGVGTNGLPVITTPITVNGGGGATIAGNNSTFRIFAISGSAGGSLTLNGITVTGGNVAGQGPAGFGGGIFNFGGTLVLNRSVVTGNTASSAGGGIASGTMGSGAGATLTLNNSEVSWNTAPPSGMGGGGILSIAGTLNINNSTIDHNSGPGGGGIATGNGSGGGPGSAVTINNSVISDNNATGGEETGGGGVSNGGTLQMNNTQLTGNDADGGTGGGLLNHATATLNNVSATGNSAAVGAGIANINLQGIGDATSPVPAITLNNGNVSRNTASVAGGGIANVSPFGAPLGQVTLHNTQVNGNSPNNCIPVGSIAGCNDTVFVFTAVLNAGNQNPPVASTGAGTATVTWNTLTNEMTVDVTFSGLTTTTTAAHIHCCVKPPGNAGVATTPPTFPGFPLGVTAGSYSRTFDMTVPASYNPAFVTAQGGATASAEAALLAGLQAGQAYLNIHTMMFPGGEIRGFLQEP